MNYLKQQKEIVLLIAVGITLGIASYNLFNDQQENSELLNSGTTIDPVTISGRAACEVPIPDISKEQNSKSSSFETKDIIN